MSERTFYERVFEIRGFHYIKLKSGRLITFWDARTAAERAETDLVRAVSRAIKLAKASTDREFREWDLERVRWFITGVHEWVHAVEHHLDELGGVMTEEQRIERLRITSGRTPEEAELFRRKADELERKLKERP